MTTIFLYLVCTVFSVLPFSVKEEQGIHLSITNLRSNKGHVLLSVFNSPDGFPQKAEKAFLKQKIDISNHQATILLSSIPAGTYAIAMVHDENDDMKMNTNALGIPKEGYGFSNNAMGTFGPPSFSRASFVHKEGAATKISIKVKN